MEKLHVLVKNSEEENRMKEDENEIARNHRRNLVVGGERNQNLHLDRKVEERKVVDKPLSRKRKVGEDMNLQSMKRCRTPILSGPEREAATDKILTNTFNFNTLLTRHEPEPAGAARRELPGSPSQGVGDDAVFCLENMDSPESPARIGFVRQHSRCTASLVSDQNK